MSSAEGLDERLARLRARLDELRVRDPDLRVFGARGHEHARRPATPAKVSVFEARHGIRLPDEFRAFVLGITDGGVGPGYGLSTLDRDEEEVVEDLTLLQHPFDAQEFLALEAPPDPADDGDDDDEYDEAMSVYWREMPGTMMLCEYGCAIRAYLVVTGFLRGRVLKDSRTDTSGVFVQVRRNGKVVWTREPESEAEPLGFLDWYEAWLDEAFAELEAPR